MIGTLLTNRASGSLDSDVVTIGDSSLTRRELRDSALEVAGGLARLGVGPGDRVAVICPNRIEMAEILLGCWSRGAVAVPLNVFLKGDFLRVQLEDAAPKVVITDGAGFRGVVEQLGQVPTIEAIVTIDDVGGPSARAALLSYAALRDGEPLDQPWDDADSLASIMFTSGTTGRPKGCMLPHGYYLRVARRCTELFGLTASSRLMSALPLYHAAAQCGVLLATLVVGGSCVLEPEFRVTGQWDRIADAKATVFMGVGAMGVALLGAVPHPRERVPSLAVAYLSPFTPEQHEAFAERFEVDVTSALFGQTECFPLTYTPLAGDRRPGTCGTVAADLEMQLVDGDGAPVGVDEVGEIMVRPKEDHATFLGYWGADPSTFPSPERWHATGDLGRVDADGYLTFVDRKKDALRRRGENVSSVEVETALATHPSVAEAAVFGVPSPLGEEEVMAVLVVVPGTELTMESLFEHCATRLPYYAMPRYVEVAGELPKNAVNRVMKHLLREQGVGPHTVDLEALGLSVARTDRRS